MNRINIALRPETYFSQDVISGWKSKNRRKTVMKKSIVFIVCMLLSGTLTYAETLTFADRPICPYVCADAETGELAEQPGFLYEIMQAVFEPKGYTLKVVILPLSRAIQQVREGKFTGILGSSKDISPDFIFPDQPQAITQFCLYVKAGNSWRYEGIPSLSGMRLGGMIGLHFGVLQEYVDQYRKSDVVQLVGGEDAKEKNVKKLLAGRIDVLYDEASSLAYFLKQQGWEDRVQQADCIMKIIGYTAFSPALPQSKEYARLLSEGMEKLRESGQLQTILSKYGLKDWKE